MKKQLNLCKLTMLCIFTLFLFSVNAQTPPSLGAANNFGILAIDSIKTTDTIKVIGDAGAATYINPKIVADNIYTSVSSAQSALSSAISSCSGQTGTSISGTLKNQDLGSDVYSISGNATLSDTMILSGDTDAIYIFNITGNLTINSGAFIMTANGNPVLPNHVYWNIGGNVTVNSSFFFGVILAAGDININGPFEGYVTLLSQNTVRFNGTQNTPYLYAKYGFSVYSYANFAPVTRSLCTPPPITNCYDKIANGGFESLNPTDPCPTDINIAPDYYYEECGWLELGVYTGGSGWGMSTPDVFNSCATGDPDVPLNGFGTQAAHGGSGYIGLLAGSNFNPFFDEGTYQTLTLTAGKVYYFEMWVSLAEVSGLATTMGVEFQDGSGTGLYSYEHPTAITSKTTWTQIKTCFTATGTEAMMAIIRRGSTSSVTPVNVVPGTGYTYDVALSDRIAYYYVDDVALKSLAEAGPDIPSTCSTTVSVGCGTTIAGATYSWTPADVFTSTNSTIGTPSAVTTNVTMNVNGTYTYTLTVTYGGCVATDQVVITNNMINSVTATATPNTINLGGSSSLAATAVPGTGVTYTWAPTTLSGTPVTVYPVATTIYTVTATNAAGCTKTDTTMVTVVYPQCNITIGTTITGPTTTSAIFGGGSPTISNLNISLSGTLTVDNPTITFNNCNFLCSSTAKIVVPVNRTLVLGNYTHLFSCTSLWNGIEVQNGGTFNAGQNTFIEDALSGIKSTGGGTINLNTVIFNKNLVGVDIQALAGTHPTTVRSCVFTSRWIPSTATPTSNYSAASLLTYPLANFPISKLQSPWTSETSCFGVQITNVNSVTIGVDAASATNTFDAHKAGIYANNPTATAGTLTVYNNHFQNMVRYFNCTLGGCFSTFNGYGVYSVGTTTGTHLLTVGGTGGNGYKPNTFDDCFRGVEAKDIKGTSVNFNTFNTVVTAAGGSFPYPGETGVYVTPANNNSISVTDNGVNNYETGIRINRNGTNAINANNLQVNTNTISADASGYCNNGIYVTDLLAGTTVTPTLSEIKDNIVTEAYTCINISNSKKIINIKTNSVTTRYLSSGNTNGIKIAGGQNLKVENNHTKYNVTTAGLAGGNSLAYGIFLQNSSSMIVKCNTSEDAYKSLIFEGACSSPTASGFGITQNTMRRANYGFTLNSSGVIGQQGSATVASNNYFDLTAGNYFTIAHTLANNSSAPSSILYVNNVTTGLATRPTVNNAGGTGTAYLWGTSLMNSTGSPASCGYVPAYVLHDDGPGMRDYTGDTTYMNYLEELAVDTLNLDLYSEQVNWQLDNYTYNVIHQDSTLLSSSDLDSFYTANSTNSIGLFTSVNDLIEQGDYNNAISTNNSVTVNDSIEYNQQAVNALILAQLTDTNYVFDSTDIAVLTLIANQCPVSGGDAVYQSRHLLMDYNDRVIEFIDNCEPEERTFIAPPVYSPTINNSFMLYPNPNNGNMTLSYQLNPGDNGILKIYDYTGKVVFNYNLSPGINKQVISNMNLSNGLYPCYVFVNGKLMYSNKVIIIK